MSKEVSEGRSWRNIFTNGSPCIRLINLEGPGFKRLRARYPEGELLEVEFVAFPLVHTFCHPLGSMWRAEPSAPWRCSVLLDFEDGADESINDPHELSRFYERNRRKIGEFADKDVAFQEIVAASGRFGVLFKMKSRFLSPLEQLADCAE